MNRCIIFLFALFCHVYCEKTITLTCESTNSAYQLKPNENVLYNITNAVNCKVQFGVPRYQVPIFITHTKRSSKYYNLTFTQDAAMYKERRYDASEVENGRLDPTSFIMELTTTRDIGELNILISLDNVTAPHSQKTLYNNEPVVDTFLIDTQTLPSHVLYSIAEKYDIIKAINFTDITIMRPITKRIFFYQNDSFIGTLDDLLHMDTPFPINSGILSFVSTNVKSFQFSLILSPTYSWPSSHIEYITEMSPIPPKLALNGVTNSKYTIYHSIRQLEEGTIIPTRIYNILMANCNSFQIYAGCITAPRDNLLLLDIDKNSSNAYQHIMINSRCRTYVISESCKVEWNQEKSYDMNFKYKPGNKGLIMSNDVPLLSKNNSSLHTLIQAEEKENIIVDYNIVHNDNADSIEISNYMRSKRNPIVISPPNNTFSVGPSYQQGISFTVPKNSTGFIIRFSVRSSSRYISTMSIITTIIIYYFL